MWPPPYHQAIVSFTGCINISFDICDSTFSYKSKIDYQNPNSIKMNIKIIRWNNPFSPISMLVLQFQKPTLQNVTVIPNGPSSALPAFYSSSSPTSSRVSQVVGSTLETWFRTNLNATPCHSTSLPFLTTSTKEEDKGKG